MIVERGKKKKKDCEIIFENQSTVNVKITVIVLSRHCYYTCNYSNNFIYIIITKKNYLSINATYINVKN